MDHHQTRQNIKHSFFDISNFDRSSPRLAFGQPFGLKAVLELKKTPFCPTQQCSKEPESKPLSFPHLIRWTSQPWPRVVGPGMEADRLRGSDFGTLMGRPPPPWGGRPTPCQQTFGLRWALGGVPIFIFLNFFKRCDVCENSNAHIPLKSRFWLFRKPHSQVLCSFFQLIQG